MRMDCFYDQRSFDRIFFLISVIRDSSLYFYALRIQDSLSVHCEEIYYNSIKERLVSGDIREMNYEELDEDRRRLSISGLFSALADKL